MTATAPDENPVEETVVSDEDKAAEALAGEDELQARLNAMPDPAARAAC